MNCSYRVSWLVASLLLLVSLASCGNERVTCDASKWPRRAFNEIDWRMADQSKRYVFVQELIHSRLSTGISRAEVEQLLGKPDYASSDSTYVTYVVADRLATTCLFHSIALLHVEFDEQEKLTRALIRFD
jgi:hypothetical protein